MSTQRRSRGEKNLPAASTGRDALDRRFEAVGSRRDEPNRCSPGGQCHRPRRPRLAQAAGIACYQDLPVSIDFSGDDVVVANQPGDGCCSRLTHDVARLAELLHGAVNEHRHAVGDP